MSQKSSKKIHENKQFVVVQDEVIYSNGLSKTHTYIKKNNAVLIAPFWNNKLGLIELDRHLIDEKSLELPGGRIKNGQNELDAAKMELKEELNLIGNNWELLGTVFPLPSITNEKVYIYFTEVSSLDNIKLQKKEFISSIKFYGEKELQTLLKDNLIRSGVDGYAISLFLLKKQKLLAKQG